MAVKRGAAPMLPPPSPPSTHHRNWCDAGMTQSQGDTHAIRSDNKGLTTESHGSHAQFFTFFGISSLAKQTQKQLEKEQKAEEKREKEQLKNQRKDSSSSTTQDEEKKSQFGLFGTFSSLFTSGPKKNKRSSDSCQHCRHLPVNWIGCEDMYENVSELVVLDECSWFHHGMSRNEAELLMTKKLGQDGTFLVRCSERGGSQFPFVLCVNKGGELFNIQIGVRGRGPMEYALGSEKQDELRFPSVPDLIDGYHTHQLELFKNGRSVGFVTLKSG